jgi:hypothetical protein
LVVAVVMIVAGATGALAAGTEALLWFSNPTFTVGFVQSLQLLSMVLLAAWAATETALIVGLLALARTFLAKP